MGGSCFVPLPYSLGSQPSSLLKTKKGRHTDIPINLLTS